MGRAFEYRRAAKEKRWDKMSKVFPKLAKAITAAAKESGADPASNAKLRTAIATAKAQNMPKDNIDAAIKRASGKDGAFSELSYEGKAANGVLIFIECTTDNPTRTIANLKSYFNKSPGAFIVPNGSLEFMFARKSVFAFSKPESLPLDELAQPHRLWARGARVFRDGSLIAYGGYADFGALSEGLESLQITPTSAKLARIPTSPITLSEEQIES